MTIATEPTMKSTANIALIGCGRIAQRVHLRVIAKDQGNRVVALADPDPQRLAEAARRAPGALLFHSLEALLAESSADGVVLALPPSRHAAAAIAAFDAGKHVYLEKPGAVTAAEAISVRQSWRAAGTVGMIGLNQRYHPMYIELRSAIRQGRLGDLVGARSVFCAAARELPPWKRDRATGGGALLDLAIHHVDLMRFLFDREVENVGARIRSVRSEGDTAALDLRMADGPLVQVFVSMSAAEQDCLEVYGTQGRVVADRYGSGRLQFLAPKRPLSRGGRVRSLLGHVTDQVRIAGGSGADPSHAGALRVFVEAVKQGNPAAVVGLDDSYRSLAVIFAAERAAEKGEPVSPQDPAQSIRMPTA